MMTHDDAFYKYLSLEKRYSHHTLTSYQNDINQFDLYVMSALAITDIRDIRHFHVRSWMVHLMKNGYNAKSINRKISSLRSYFKFLIKTARLDSNPMTKVVAPKLPKRLPKVIRQDALHNLLSQNDKHDAFSEVRDRTIIDLLYSTGMRRAELIALEDSDIQNDRMQIKVLGKGNKERLIPINKKLSSALERYKSIRDAAFEDVPIKLFVTDSGKSLYPKFVYNLVTSYLADYTSSEKRSPHVLRHSFATHMANAGADLNAIKEIMGHSSLASTQIYMHNTIDRLKNVYQKSHPKAGENNLEKK